MRRAIVHSAMRAIVIVLLDPTSDRGPRFLEAPILCRPDFFFIQAAMEPFDVAVDFRVTVRRAAVRDAGNRRGFRVKSLCRAKLHTHQGGCK
jgi:hypothetical protein